MLDDPDRDRRAEARRARMTVCRLDEPGDAPPSASTPEERIAAIWALTVDAWSLAGHVIPDLDLERAQMPVVCVRRGE
jgi:hypothetical protein